MKKRSNQITLRLGNDARAALDELSSRWECADGVLIRSVLVQLARRTDLTSILDLSTQSHVTLLRRCRDALDRAILAAEKSA